MGKLTAADIDRWKPDEIASVFGISQNISDHSVNTSTQLQQLSVFGTWSGHAADSAHDSVHRTRADLDRHGDMAKKVADAARAAEGEVIQVKASLGALRRAIAAAGFAFDPATDTISDPHPPAHLSTHDSEKRKHTLDDLVTQLERVLTAADKADHDLAAAISVADGATTPEAAKKQAVSWTPTAADVVLGGTAGATAAKTDILRDIWLKGMGKHPSGVDARIAPWLEDIKGIKGLSGVGGAVGVITAIPSVIADHGQDHDTWAQAITREGGSLTAATATDTAVGAGTELTINALTQSGAEAAGGAAAAEMGAETGAEAGALAGSAVPELGTVAGAVVGAAAGAAVGYLTSKGIESIFKHP